jgi:hypothetical protein
MRRALKSGRRTRPWPVLAAAACLVLAGTLSSCSGHTAAKDSPKRHKSRTVLAGGIDVPGSINDTCQKDVTVSLGAWLYSLPDGTPDTPTTVNFRSGCYLISGTLYLRDFQHFVFEGGKFEEGTPVPGEMSSAGPDRAAYCGDNNVYTDADETTYTLDKVTLMFFMEGGCYITFRNMTFAGKNKTGGQYKLEQDTFITFAGSQYALVDHVHMRNPYGDYVDAQALHEVPGGQQSNYPATNVTIENSSMRGAGRQGIGIIMANHINVFDNKIFSAWATVFDVEFDVIGGFQTDIRIDDNTIVGFHYAYVLSAQTGAEIERLQFDGNRMIDGGQMRVVIVDKLPGSNVRISDNYASSVSTASDGHQPAIRIDGISGSSIEIDQNSAPNDVAGFASVPPGTLVCEDGAGTGKCPATSPVSPPALAKLP